MVVLLLVVSVLGLLLLPLMVVGVVDSGGGRGDSRTRTEASNLLLNASKC